MNETRDLDPVALERLYHLGGREFAVKMVGLFLEYVAEKIAEARSAQVAGDLPALANAVHPIKSSAGNVGACRVLAVAQSIETLALRGEGQTLAVLVAELEQAYAAVKPELEAKQKSPPNQPPTT